MKHTVLVIDDRWVEREVGYRRLEGEVAAALKGVPVAFEYLKKPNDLPSALHQNRYAGAIVDAVLHEIWEGFTLVDALNELGDTIPFAVLSAWWHNAMASQIDEALKKPNWKAFIHWRDIEPDGTVQINYAVRLIVRMITEQLRLDTHLNLRADDSVRILHISDVQSGGFDDKALRLEASRCADRILNHWKEIPPTFVAFTGDVAEHGSPAQYELAFEWISYFFERLRLGALPARNLLYVPGNHDVNLNLAASARIGIRKGSSGDSLQLTLEDKMTRPELLEYAYAPFRSFLKRIGDCPLLPDSPDDQSLPWVEACYRHLGVTFYGLNTARPASAFGVPERRVNPDALARIGVELDRIVNESGAAAPLVIGLGHHCPVSAGEDAAVTNVKDFAKFFGGRARTALFLHGHTHEHKLDYQSGGEFRLVRSCATTLTKPGEARPPDSLRGFNLLELTRKEHTVRSLRAASFGWLDDSIRKLRDEREWVLQEDGMFLEKVTMSS